jgi:hypothetical protein
VVLQIFRDTFIEKLLKFRLRQSSGQSLCKLIESSSYVIFEYLIQLLHFDTIHGHASILELKEIHFKILNIFVGIDFIVLKRIHNQL